MKTLVLLSGGLDSTVILANFVKYGDECAAVAFNYLQEHDIELERAEEIAVHYQVPFEIVTLPVLPKSDDVVIVGRNLLFVATAVSVAFVQKCGMIAIGCNASDWHNFPDCRPAFWTSVKRAVEDAYRITVVTPLLHYTKIDVIKMARELGVPIEMTWSCYHPKLDAEYGDHKPCGECLACKTREYALQWQESA
jgi:7-cyano-7-deazaguanine synthase